MKSILRTSIFCVIFFGLLYGQKENNEKPPLALTVKPLKTTFEIREKWEYEIRIENRNNDILKIPKEIENRRGSGLDIGHFDFVSDCSIYSKRNLKGGEEWLFG